mgnify:CR=1 FL=1
MVQQPQKVDSWRSCSSYVMMIEASSPKNVAEVSISNKLGDSTLVDKVYDIDCIIGNGFGDLASV